MNQYLTSPVTPIVAGVVAVAIVIAIFTTVASKRRKEREREAWAAAQRVKAQEALDRLRERELEERRSRVIRGLEQTSAKVRRKAAPTRRASVPAPKRPGFRTDAPSRRSDNDDSLPFIGSIIAMDMFHSDPTPSRDDSGSSHSNSNDSGGYSGGSDSGGSSGGSSDSGGSFGGGDSGSF